MYFMFLWKRKTTLSEVILQFLNWIPELNTPLSVNAVAITKCLLKVIIILSQDGDIYATHHEKKQINILENNYMSSVRYNDNCIVGNGYLSLCNDVIAFFSQRNTHRKKQWTCNYSCKVCIWCIHYQESISNHFLLLLTLYSSPVYFYLSLS